MRPGGPNPREHDSQAAQPADVSLPSLDLQQLWFQTRLRSWSSLVVVPADPEHSVAPIAQGLADVARVFSDKPPRVFAAEEMDPPAIAQLVADLSRRRNASTGGALSGERIGGDKMPDGPIMVSIESVLSNPLGIGIAQAADAVLLCIHMSESSLASAQRTVELIGRAHFIGSVALKRG